MNIQPLLDGSSINMETFKLAAKSNVKWPSRGRIIAGIREYQPLTLFIAVMFYAKLFIAIGIEYLSSLIQNTHYRI